MPSARQTIAIAVVARCFRSDRKANRRSWRSVSMAFGSLLERIGSYASHEGDLSLAQDDSGCGQMVEAGRFPSMSKPIAVVTGASKGIGRAIAMRLPRRTTSLVSRDPKQSSTRSRRDRRDRRQLSHDRRRHHRRRRGARRTRRRRRAGARQQRRHRRDEAVSRALARRMAVDGRPEPQCAV